MHRTPLFAIFLSLLGSLFMPAVQAQDDLLTLASRGETELVLVSLNEQTPVNALQADGTSLLHWAIYYDDELLVQNLLALGADASLKNNYGATPLSQAAITGNPGIISRLLAARADPDERSADDQTALMILARTENLDAARVLLDAGADVNAVESFRGQAALMWAAAQNRPQMLKLLLDHGADPNARSSPNDWPRQVSAEPRMKFLPSGALTPLLYAVREGCTECVTYLIEADADIHADDPEGISPLIMACLNAHWDAARLLVEAGAVSMNGTSTDALRFMPPWTTIQYLMAGVPINFPMILLPALSSWPCCLKTGRTRICN
jgi:ankyrin repeat protein